MYKFIYPHTNSPHAKESHITMKTTYATQIALCAHLHCFYYVSPTNVLLSKMLGRSLVLFLG